MPDERYAPPAMRPGAVQQRLPASLRDHGAFRLLFAGQALSVVGDRITPVAIAFAVLGLGSATDLGLVMAAGGIPFALFALAGGVWADHLGRRRVMLASDVIRALSQTVTAVLLLTGSAEVWMLAVLSFVYGTAAAVFMPALIGLIPQTVGHERLQEANGLLALTRSVASVGGPALAGVIIVASGTGRGDRRRRGDVRGERAVPGADAAERRARGRGGRRSDAPAHEPFLAGLREGWHEVRSRTWLMWGLIAMSVYHVFVLPSVFVLGPTLADARARRRLELGGHRRLLRGRRRAGQPRRAAHPAAPAGLHRRARARGRQHAGGDHRQRARHRRDRARSSCWPASASRSSSPSGT